MDLCKVSLLGRLGQDPRVRKLDDGTPVLNLSVATSRKKKGQDVTYWWDVTRFGEQGLKLHDMLEKGARVWVEGDYSEREYVDKQGQHRVQREVVAREIIIIDRKRDGSEASAQQGSQAYGGQPRAGQGGGNPFGNQRSRPQPAQAASGGGGFGGRHRDDFAPGGRTQGTFGGAAAGGGYGYDAPPPPDDDIPF